MLVMLAIWLGIILSIALTVLVLNWENMKQEKEESPEAESSIAPEN